MHELSIALSILDIAEEEAERQGGRVAAVHLQARPPLRRGPEALPSAYELAREGTPLAEAELVVEEVPIVGVLPGLRRGAYAGRRRRSCAAPTAATPTPEVVSGRELEVVALEIES